MKPDDKTERIKPVEDREENPSIERERESEAAEVQEPQPTGWAAQLRQIMHGSAQGEARTNIKRQQLREDRTKSFLLLGGSRLCWRLRSLLCSPRPARAERTSPEPTSPTSAADQAERIRIQATR